MSVFHSNNLSLAINKPPFFINSIPHLLSKTSLKQQLTLITTRRTWASIWGFHVSCGEVCRESAVSSEIRSDILLVEVVNVILFDKFQRSSIFIKLHLLKRHCPSALVPAPISPLPRRMRGQLGHLEHLLVLKCLKRLQLVLSVLSPFDILKLLLRLP